MALVTDFKSERAAASIVAFGESWRALIGAVDSLNRTGLTRNSLMLLICDEFGCTLRQAESLVTILESNE